MLSYLSANFFFPNKKSFNKGGYGPQLSQEYWRKDLCHYLTMIRCHQTTKIGMTGCCSKSQTHNNSESRSLICNLLAFFARIGFLYLYLPKGVSQELATYSSGIGHPPTILRRSRYPRPKIVLWEYTQNKKGSDNKGA